MYKKDLAIVIVIAIIISIGILNFKQNRETVITSSNSIEEQNIYKKTWKERLGIDDAEIKKIMKEGERLGLTEVAKKIILEKGKTQCQYGAYDGGHRINVIAFVDGEKYRTEFEIDGKKNYSVFNGSTLYNWIDGEVIGSKIAINCLKDLKKRGMEIDPFDKEISNEVIESQNLPDIFEEAVGIKCKKTKEVDLAVPTKVNFIDQCELLKEQQDLIKNLNKI